MRCSAPISHLHTPTHTFIHALYVSLCLTPGLLNLNNTPLISMINNEDFKTRLLHRGALHVSWCCASVVFFILFLYIYERITNQLTHIDHGAFRAHFAQLLIQSWLLYFWQDIIDGSVWRCRSKNNKNTHEDVLMIFVVNETTQQYIKVQLKQLKDRKLLYNILFVM